MVEVAGLAGDGMEIGDGVQSLPVANLSFRSMWQIFLLLEDFNFDYRFGQELGNGPWNLWVQAQTSTIMSGPK